jgi:hypothetical protein
MAHYYDDIEETEEDRENARIHKLANELRELPASKFSVDEIGLLLRTDWSKYKENYYGYERERILSLAKREGLA